jgi:hypothetical protein
MPQASSSLTSLPASARAVVAAAAPTGCSTPVVMATGCQPSVVAPDTTTLHSNQFMHLMRSSNGNDPGSIISTPATAARLNQQAVHATTPLILNLTPLPGSGGLLILSSQSVEAPVSSRPPPAVDNRGSWHSANACNGSENFSTAEPLTSNDAAINCSKTFSTRPPSREKSDVKNMDSLGQEFPVACVAKCVDMVSDSVLDAHRDKCTANILDSLPLSQTTYCTNYHALSMANGDSIKTDCNSMDNFDCLSLLIEHANDCMNNLSNQVSAVDCVDVDNSTCVGDGDKKHRTDNIVDELDDILHLVNESLGQCDGDEDASSSLHDYDISLGDSFTAVTSPKNPSVASNLDYGHCAGDSNKLVKITDYSPEWSYAEVSIQQCNWKQFCVLHNFPTN